MARRLSAHRHVGRLIAAGAWLAIAAAGGGCDWPWRHDMVDAPSRPAGAGPRPEAAGAVPMAGELRRPVDAAGDLVNPIDAAASTEPGRALYAVYCAPCHGVTGKGEGVVARYYPPVGDLTRNEVQRRTDGWHYAVIVNGIGTMPSFAHEIEPIERWQVVRFVRTLGAPAP